MYGKILIRCDLEVRTGMHIGGSSAFSAIGAVDSPVVRDPYTGYPIVPGPEVATKTPSKSSACSVPRNRYAVPACSLRMPFCPMPKSFPMWV